MPRRRVGTRIGPFTLTGELGRGGNSFVYCARSESGGTVALKVLDLRRRSSEPYRRFRQEVRKHLELTKESFEGVLPLIDYHVPDEPTEEDPPWLAMPVAAELRAALGSEPRLEDVVDAVASVAETLARLHAIESRTVT